MVLCRAPSLATQSDRRTHDRRRREVSRRRKHVQVTPENICHRSFLYSNDRAESHSVDHCTALSHPFPDCGQHHDRVSTHGEKSPKMRDMGRPGPWSFAILWRKALPPHLNPHICGCACASTPLYPVRFDVMGSERQPRFVIPCHFRPHHRRSPEL